jgi:hypothetical protein
MSVAIPAVFARTLGLTSSAKRIAFGSRSCISPIHFAPSWAFVEVMPVAVGPTILDRDIPALDEAGLAQPVTERCCKIGGRFGIIDKADDRHRRLLRARPERPRRRAAE